FWTEMGAERRAFSETVLTGPRGGILVTPDMEGALDFVNAYAPEHLQIHAESPHDYIGAIRNAGEILLGAHTPICIGNFTLGPNAVLPTNAAALTRSPLSVHDYLKSIGLGYVTRTGYRALAPRAKRFAEYEGFDAHANAVSALRGA
ncbi:MAG: histidinol dehydrogenase, partial [Pseudomonadota bacterium]